MSVLKIDPIIVPTDFSNLTSFNFYIVRHERKVFLVDAGVNTEECWSIFINKLSELDLEVKDLDAIILTHHHTDHIGLVNRIKKMHDVPIFAHPKSIIRLKREVQFLQRRIQFFEKLYKKMGCGTEAENQIAHLRKSVIQNKSQAIEYTIEPIEEGDSIFGFSVLDLPGHAIDHIVLWNEASRALFSGDVVIEHILSNALIDFDKDGKRTPSLLQYENSLRRLLELHAHTIYSGHGQIIENPDIIIQQKLNRINRKADKILSLITKSHSAAEIAEKIYKDRYKKLFPLIMSEIIGHLDRLVSLHKLEVKEKDNIIYFEKVKSTVTS